MSSALIALVAIGLDVLFGDPRKLPHITRATGFIITFWENRFRSSHFDGVTSGVFFLMFVVLSIASPLYLAHALFSLINPLFGDALLVFIVYQSIAFGDLIKHVKAVLVPLAEHNLLAARKRVAWIVGRDTENLNETEISRAAIEALVESANDGVFSPLFWSLVLGPWGALLYRISNTLDSMVGHRDAHYERFGKASARLDDIMGYIPARITALLYWLVSPRNTVIEIVRDARRHSSPNAGWPEATCAHCLNIRLGGTNKYDGEIHNGPIFNTSGLPPSIESLRRALKKSYFAMLLATIIVLAIAVI